MARKASGGPSKAVKRKVSSKKKGHKEQKEQHFLVKRATEKPIEIFIALFVILAVSLLLLQMFQKQISKTTQDLGNYQTNQQREALKSTFYQSCSQLCTTAETEKSCSIDALAQICIQNSQRILGTDKYIDLNKNNKQDYDTASYGGVGVCENNIPCFLEVNNCCGQTLTPENCQQILCQMWKQRGDLGTPADPAKSAELFNAVGFTASYYGACNVGNATGNLAWWKRINTTCS